MGIANDEEAMRAAIDIAATARRTVSPRPWVGAVVVSPDGEAFAGATEGRAGPHAEIVALARAGKQAQGGTLFVTLEPCSHHGRTPPCADAVIDAGIARCVVAVTDPDVQVNGSGLGRLRDAGITTDVGLLEHEVRIQLAPYLKHRMTGRPYVVLKLAGTLDGRSAAPDGSSQWITGAAARADAHGLRADSDAILVGAGTVRADDPSLTVRLPDTARVGDDASQPLRVVLGAAPAGAKVHPCLEMRGDLGRILDELGDRGVLQLMVEGGARVAHDFHAAGLVDHYVLYLAPALFGGDDARGLFAGAGVQSIDALWRGDITAVQQLGDDIRVDMVPRTDGVERKGEG